MVYNNIYPGFPWTQVFRFPAGSFAPGGSVRAEFRKHPAAPVLLTIAPDAGVGRLNDDIILSLTGEQTALLASAAGGRIMFDMVREPDDVHLGIRVKVPVVASVTAP